MMPLIATAFGGVSGAAGDPGSIFSNVGNNNSNSVIAGLSPDKGPSQPSAYLNYILFDKDYMPLAGQSVPVPGTPNATQLMSIPTITAQELGYVFIYLSYDNAAGGDVYFDDLKITVQESPVIEVSNYYPFGMVSYTWLRPGETDNAYLFQGKELIAQTGWHDFGSRMYWADLGRWFSVDPQGQFSSPYLGMGNVPTMGSDPNGEVFWVDDLAVAVVGGVSNLISNGDHLHGFWDYFDHFVAGAVGAVVGYETMDPELGFAVGGALNTVADRLNGDKRPLLKSFITGGFSSLQGYDVGKSIEEAGWEGTSEAYAENAGVTSEGWRGTYSETYNQEYVGLTKQKIAENIEANEAHLINISGILGDFPKSKFGAVIVSGTKEGIKGYGKDNKYDGWDFLNDFALESVKQPLGFDSKSLNPSSGFSFGKASAVFGLNTLRGISKNLLNQGLKYLEGKDLDSPGKIFLDAEDDPFQFLMKDLRSR